MGAKYTIGIDFGTESGRAVLVDVANGRLVATAVFPYIYGVIDEKLPDSDVWLEPDWALQDPNDYLLTIQRTVPAVLQESGVAPADVIGVGIDFTSCTILPTTAAGTPLCFLPEWRAAPHAWVKLWKHHSAQPEADTVNRVATEMGGLFLNRYGGKISSEWFFPKALQILNEAPEVYAAAGRIIEAQDWVIWQLVGQERRSACAAGYKAMWDKEGGFPDRAFFAALDPRMADIVDEKMSHVLHQLGDRAGGLTEQAASWMGLRPDTAVAVSNMDAHGSVPACTVTEPGRMVMIMGTSTCHLLPGVEKRVVEGMCGVVEDGIVPGLVGFEAGQSCVGDHFAWFVENCVPAEVALEASRQGISVHQYLEEHASALSPGETGLVALDWWNGNRSILVDAGVTGLLVGATLATKTEDIYRALIEATAYGTRIIIESFEKSGVPVTELVACGGLPERNKLLMQIYADVTSREIRVADSPQTPALGAAMHGAVAAGADAGGYANIVDAAQRMARLRDDIYRPIPENSAVYERLYREYVLLHDYFGRGGNDVMKRLKSLKVDVLAQKRRSQTV